MKPYSLEMIVKYYDNNGFYLYFFNSFDLPKKGRKAIKLSRKVRKRHIGGYTGHHQASPQLSKAHLYQAENSELKLEIERLSILLKRYYKLWIQFYLAVVLVKSFLIMCNVSSIKSAKQHFTILLFSGAISSRLLHWLRKIQAIHNIRTANWFCREISRVRCNSDTGHSFYSLGIRWSVILAIEPRHVSKTQIQQYY